MNKRDRSPSDPKTMLLPAADSKESRQLFIGQYRVLDRLGEGGVGEVFLCEQIQPIRRKVAVKVLKQGMQSREVIARFNAERKVLASMHHSHIAQMFDAGSKDKDRPYFAMEYVPGVSITEYCQRHRMSLAAILKLFLQVCAAIEHAHQKGIIHRDLKPSNILVTEIDGEPQPKVIDFGLARALNLVTSNAERSPCGSRFVGTPQYMSPEYADLGPSVADTRSDIYSLGVILYELICGVLPLNFENLSLGEIRRLLKTSVPRPPSQRVLEKETAQFIELRIESRRELAAMLRDDLDWIVHKALEKAPERRYATVTSLADDLERFIAKKPVSVARPSRIYAFKKLLQRHVVVVIVSVTLALALIGFTIVSVSQALALADERDRANLESRKASELTEFMVGLFALPDVQSDYRQTMTVREVVDIGARRLLANGEDDSLIYTEISDSIGSIYFELGDYERAEEFFRRNLGSREGIDYPRALLGIGLVELNDERSTEALATLQRAHREFASILGANHPSTLEAKIYMGSALLASAHPEEAENVFREAYQALTENEGSTDFLQALALSGQGAVRDQMGDLSAAINLLEQAYELTLKSVGESNKHAFWVRSKLANMNLTLGNFARAEEMLRSSLHQAQAIYGEIHPKTASAYNDLAAALVYQEKFQEAEKILLLSLEIRRATARGEHRGSFRSMGNLASLYNRMGRVHEATKLFEELIPLSERVFGRISDEFGYTNMNYAALLVKQREFRRAEGLYESALEAFVALHSDQHWLVANVRRGLGEMYMRSGELEAAERELLVATDVLSKQFGETHARTARAKDLLNELRNLQSHELENEREKNTLRNLN